MNNVNYNTSVLSFICFECFVIIIISTDCGPVTIAKGTVNTTATTYGTVLQVYCNEGYELSGTPIVMCRADGIWSDIPTCDTSGKV
ncbi:hypothetical protein DPMN_041702 [Dreissena polymorpha]|uniref:Sushi domain-containing protein n=1 Tax=Dreissena polymorpha TaxID=45954 RepID=A0A9D4CZ59_DREPO|nr:hypothetical protein DPMN_041702 [Dreissena polymorpha]